MNATIILLSYNGSDYLREAIESLLPLPEHFQLLVVDNASHDHSVEIVRSISENIIVIENDKNYGFSGGMNIGIRLVMGLERRDDLDIRSTDVVVLLNQDTKCLPGWHEAILAPFSDPSVAVVGCKIYAPDGKTILHMGGRILEDRATTEHIGYQEEDCNQYNELTDVDYVTGAALVIRADVLNQIGLFDELYNPAYMEEVDLCLRVRRAGYRIVVNPDACLIHYEGTATTEHVQRLHWFNRGRLLFLIKTRPLSQLLTEFATAERAYFKTTRDFTNMRAIKRAYLDAILRLDAWCAAREVYQGQPVLQDDREQLMDLLVSLRNDCIRADCEKIDQRFQ